MPDRARRRRRRHIGPVAVLLTLVLGALAVLAVANLLKAKRQLTFARSDLQAAHRAVVGRDDGGARAALDRAAARVDAASGSAAAFPLGLLRPAPVVGSLSKGMGAAAAAAAEGVAAGQAVAAAAQSFPTRVEGGLSGSDLSGVAASARESEAKLQEAERRLDEAAARLAGPRGALLPAVSRPAKAMATELNRVAEQLDSARRGMALLADLAGPETDARLLVIAQDTLELRPTGGYIGSYGILHFTGGAVALEKYEDTQLLPPPNPVMEPPEDLGRVLPDYWSITNANWWPDFPTSAATAAEMYKRQGGGEVDGVVALTEFATARLIGALGQLQVPGYPKPVVEEGFDERVVYEVEQKRPLDQPRKKFLTALADALFQRLTHAPGDKMPAISNAVDRSVAAGDIQLWFSDPARQQKLAGMVVEGRLPKTDRDFLMLVDSNLTASKANLGLVKEVTYHVRRRDDGYLEARLEAVVRNDEPVDELLNPYYNGYLRVYVPADAELLGDVPDQGDRGMAADGPYRVFSQLLDIDPETTQRVRFDYLLPPSAAPDGDYRLTWMRQAGTPRDSLRAVVDGRTVVIDGSSRSRTVDASLRGNAVAEWFRDRWIVRKLGF
jgi:hypothetical protein